MPSVPSRGRPKAPGDVTITIRLTQAEAAVLRALAHRLDRTLTGQCRWILRQAMAESAETNNEESSDE